MGLIQLGRHDKDGAPDVITGSLEKAVNWALRQIGKRNRDLNNAAIEAANDIRKIDSKAARWIASSS